MTEIKDTLEEMLMHLESGPGAGPALLERTRAIAERMVASGEITAEQGRQQIEYLDKALTQMQQDLGDR